MKGLVLFMNGNKILTEKRLIELTLVILLKILLDITYIYFVSSRFQYMGFGLNFSTTKLIESYILLTFIYWFLPTSENKPSDVGSKILFILMILPTLSLYGLKGESRSFMYLFVSGFFITLLSIKFLPNLLMKFKNTKTILSITKASAKINFSQYINTTTTLYIILGIISIVVYSNLIKFMGLPSLRALDFQNVYEIRSSANWGPFFMGYLVPWQAKVVNVFLISLAWYKRHYFGLIMALSLQVLLYLITAHKEFLFIPIIVVAIIYSIEKSRMFMLSLLGTFVTVFLTFGLYLTGISVTPASMFIRRTFFIPAQNNFYYYDFFSNNELMYLSHSIFRLFLENPYNMATQNIIGMKYYDSPDMWANTGYITDGYMNFGIAGILVFSVVLGMIFLLMDAIVKRTSSPVVIGTMIIPIFSLVNGALFTTMLTHGAIFSVLIIWLYSYRKKAVIGSS